MSETTREPDARRLATDARDRVRFEEDALALSDQVYRVARHLVGSREEAEDLMQETYARAFRSWRATRKTWSDRSSASSSNRTRSRASSAMRLASVWVGSLMVAPPY